MAKTGKDGSRRTPTRAARMMNASLAVGLGLAFCEHDSGNMRVFSSIFIYPSSLSLAAFGGYFVNLHLCIYALDFVPAASSF